MRGLPNNFHAPLPPAVDVLDTIHFINARNIVNKLHYLDNLLSTSNLGLICITETWLNPSINDSLLCNGHNYILYFFLEKTKLPMVAVFAYSSVI